MGHVLVQRLAVSRYACFCPGMVLRWSYVTNYPLRDAGRSRQRLYQASAIEGRARAGGDREACSEELYDPPADSGGIESADHGERGGRDRGDLQLAKRGPVTLLRPQQPQRPHGPRGRADVRRAETVML